VVGGAGPRGLWVAVIITVVGGHTVGPARAVVGAAVAGRSGGLAAHWLLRLKKPF
jgi:hypothetical protein